MVRCFAFLDLCGFTDFADRHGDDNAVLELRALRSTVRDVAPLAGVRIDKWLGDGVMLVGVQCEAVVAAVLTINQHLTEQARLPLRAGLANGEVILMEGDDYVGRAVNIAARLCEHAEAGQLVAWASDLHTPSWVTATTLEPLRVKGFSGTIDAVALDIDIEGEPTPTLSACPSMPRTAEGLCHVFDQPTDTAVGVTADRFAVQGAGAVMPELERLRMLSRIAEQVGEGVAVVDNDAWFVYANNAFAVMHGCRPDELEMTSARAFYDPSEWNGPVQSMIKEALHRGVGRGEVTRSRVDGTTFPAHVTLSLLHDEAGALVGRVLCVQDITVRKQLEARLHRAALHDPLTDLPNRRLLLDRLEHGLALAERVNTAVAVLFIDLDGFKLVNDSHGHHAGDQLLVRSADRLRGCLRDADTLARLGGDEFVVLLEGVRDSRQATASAQRMLHVLARPFKLDRATVHISASIGIALGHGGRPQSLLHAADAAMYKAKSIGPGQMATSEPDVLGAPADCRINRSDGSRQQADIDR